MPDNKIIQVKNLNKVFKLKQKSAGFAAGLRSLFKPEYKEIKAVDNISFTVQAGEIIAFIGPNGAGKSTTIKMLSGILFPSSGAINVLGFDPTKKRQQLAFHIGLVFGQKPQLWYHLPPEDTYNLFAKIYELDEKAYQERFKFLVDAFEIKNLLRTPVRKLSLGQRMRCEIVASLLHRPKIIFLDEPTIGLDVIAKQHIRDVIKHLNKEEQVTIFLTSHDAGDIEALASRTIVINHGKLIFDNATEELKKKFIKTKIVELVTEGSIKSFNFQGGKVVEQGKFNLRVELDTATSSIEKLLAYAVENFSIKDINIYDPPMEEIIAAIYREQQL
ncbi:MAG: ABC transporter ATP-binding protein [Candidatus Abawacabacteria bacterium]|nr:ABC transporter ATP-binding protein [Candidatus Abawacabacteria bacterium]